MRTSGIGERSSHRILILSTASREVLSQTQTGGESEDRLFSFLADLAGGGDDGAEN